MAQDDTDECLKAMQGGHKCKYESAGLLFRFCLSICFSVSQGWINFFSLPDGLRQLFGDHNPSSTFMCCVIYDLEGSNDAYPHGANLTLVGEIYFP
jgi:hypothetical protein